MREVSERFYYWTIGLLAGMKGEYSPSGDCVVTLDVCLLGVIDFCFESGIQSPGRGNADCGG